MVKIILIVIGILLILFIILCYCIIRFDWDKKLSDELQSIVKNSNSPFFKVRKPEPIELDNSKVKKISKLIRGSKKTTVGNRQVF